MTTVQDKHIPGLHHVTAIASDPQRNLNFYTGVLGLRLVKLTVNFDAPDTYHFYFGDALGHPGTILTFFPWPDAARGRIGAGQATSTAFSIPETAIGYWLDRLEQQAVTHSAPTERFGDQVITLADPDGLRIDLIAHADNRTGWAQGGVPEAYTIRGFHSVTLSIAGYEPTARLLTDVLGYRLVAHEGSRYRYAVGTVDAVASAQADADPTPNQIIDIIDVPGSPRGNNAAGTVHHIALRTPTFEEHDAWRETLANQGYNVTPIIDRQYFHSIYFREPGGVLFEIATDAPGMAIDETPDSLGTTLRLPRQYESRRALIAASLPRLTLPTLQPQAGQK